MSAAATGGPAPVPLGKIEAELSRQMRALQGEGEAPVQRVRMSNLVIYCDSASAEAVEEQVPDVVALHPSRVLLLISDPEGPPQATATVSVRAHRLGRNQQACSEQVVLRGSPAAAQNFHFAVRSLAVGDLPTNLWWAVPMPPALAGMLLFNLAESAQQIMYDSVGWPEPARGVATTASWLEAVERITPGGFWRVASDLNWRRLKYWRRIVSQALSPASAPGAAESIGEVAVEHGPHAVVQGYELVGWIAQRLGWKVRAGKARGGVETVWRFIAPGREVTVKVKRLSDGPPEIRQVRIGCTLGGKPATLSLAAEADNRLSITVAGTDAAPRTITVPPLTSAELIGRQLSDRERDPVFRHSMTVAEQMAQSVLG